MAQPLQGGLPAPQPPPTSAAATAAHLAAGQAALMAQQRQRAAMQQQQQVPICVICITVSLGPVIGNVCLRLSSSGYLVQVFLQFYNATRACPMQEAHAAT